MAVGSCGDSGAPLAAGLPRAWGGMLCLGCGGYPQHEGGCPDGAAGGPAAGMCGCTARL